MNDTNQNDYIQLIFEAMNKNLNKNTIWMNRNGMEQLLPEFRRNHNAKLKYSHAIVLKVNKQNINKSSNYNLNIDMLLKL